MGSSNPVQNLPRPGQPSDTPQPVYKPGSIPNVTTFSFSEVEPPSPIYVQRDDVLVLQASTTLAAGDTVTINARLLQSPFAQGGQPEDADPNKPTGRVITHGIIEPIQRQLAVPAGSALVQLAIPMTEGYLLSLAVLSSGALARGVTYIRAYLIRGTSTLANPASYEVLVADYVTTQGAAGWPNGRNVYPTEGPGNLISTLVANPGAGVDWNLGVSSLRRWRIVAISALFTSSVAVANRTPTLMIQRAAVNSEFQTGNNNLQAASLNIRYSYGPGAGTFQAGPTAFVASLPESLIIQGSDQIQTITNNIQAADAWTQIVVIAEEWIDNL